MLTYTDRQRLVILPSSQVATIRRALLSGIETANAASNKATHYHSNKDTQDAVVKKVRELYDTSKEIGLLLANMDGSSGYFIQTVLLEEFRRGTLNGATNIVIADLWFDYIQSNLIGSIITKLERNNGVGYVLRFFDMLRTNKVNNSRSKRFVLEYLWRKSGNDFFYVKYRNKVERALRHAYGAKTVRYLTSVAKDSVSTGTVITSDTVTNLIGRYFHGDLMKAYKLLLYVFKETNVLYGKTSEFPVINNVLAIKSTTTSDIVFSVNNVPPEVIEGILSQKNHALYDVLWSSKEKQNDTKRKLKKNTVTVTATQMVRETKQREKLGVDKKAELSKVHNFMALYKTGYETKFTDELNAQIDALAVKNKIQDFAYRNVLVIYDQSISTMGHHVESKNTPKAIVDFNYRIIKNSVDSIKLVKTGTNVTDLATPLIRGLKEVGDDIDAIIVLSDGYENHPYDGALSDVLNAWKKRIDRHVAVFHISPIVSAEMGATVRKLGEGISTVSGVNPTGLGAQFAATLLEQNTKLWLENEIRRITEL